MRTPGTPHGCQEAAQCPEPPLLPISDSGIQGWSKDQTTNTAWGVGTRTEREGVLNNLVQNGYQTTEPNQIGTQNSKRGENTTQNAKSPRPGASSRATARHARIRLPPAEIATACTTGAANATGGGRAGAAPTPGRAAAGAGGTAAPPQREREGVLNKLIQTGHHTTKPNR